MNFYLAWCACVSIVLVYGLVHEDLAECDVVERAVRPRQVFGRNILHTRMSGKKADGALQCFEEIRGLDELSLRGSLRARIDDAEVKHIALKLRSHHGRTSEEEPKLPQLVGLDMAPPVQKALANHPL